ncbi:MAG: hypothetical protein WBP81_28695 [Solirubrobacteraceae bacterium]
MQRHLALLGLVGAHVQRPVAQIDVLVIERERLAEPQPAISPITVA